MSTIPKALEESAMLDGASYVLLFQIELPLIKATLATVILYYAVVRRSAFIVSKRLLINPKTLKCSKRNRFIFLEIPKFSC